MMSVSNSLLTRKLTAVRPEIPITAATTSITIPLVVSDGCYKTNTLVAVFATSQLETLATVCQRRVSSDGALIISYDVVAKYNGADYVRLTHCIGNAHRIPDARNTVGSQPIWVKLLISGVPLPRSTQKIGIPVELANMLPSVTDMVEHYVSSIAAGRSIPPSWRADLLGIGMASFAADMEQKVAIVSKALQEREDRADTINFDDPENNQDGQGESIHPREDLSQPELHDLLDRDRASRRGE